MAASAALIDRVDRELGRLVADLERAGELDNTLIVFLSDNGASARRITGAPGTGCCSTSTNWPAATPTAHGR